MSKNFFTEGLVFLLKMYYLYIGFQKSLSDWFPIRWLVLYQITLSLRR